MCEYTKWFHYISNVKFSYEYHNQLSANMSRYRGLGVETDYIHFFQKMSYIHFPSVKQPYFACNKPLHPISS